MTRWLFVLALAMALPAFAQKSQKAPSPPAAKAPASPEELLKQAEAAEAAGNLDSAIELLQRAAAMPSASGDVSLRLGRLLESKFNLDGAIAAFQAAAGKLTGSGKGEALGRMALAQEARGFAEATASAEAALAADPEGAWPQLAMSRVRARQGKADEAVQLAQKAAAAGPAAQAALAYAHEAKGDLKSAEQAYRSALSAGVNVGASIGLARVLRKSGRAAEAEPLVVKAIDLAPGAVEAYKEAARVKIALGRPQEAVGDAATAAALAEKDSDAQKLVQEVAVATALGYLATNQAELAVTELTALRDKDPASAEIRLGLGKALVARRQADAALVELQKAAELAADQAEAHYQLGFVQHVMKGNAAAAVPAYEKAVTLDPANLDFRTSYGASLSHTKQYDRAIAELQKVTSDANYKKADAWIYLGEAQLGGKRYKDAIVSLDKAVTLAPTSAQAEAYLGWCYFGLKDAENFKKHAGKARTLGHKEPTLLDYLRRVEAGEAIK
jgi:tetratricopeptide (TPR) repeat protein